MGDDVFDKAWVPSEPRRQRVLSEGAEDKAEWKGPLCAKCYREEKETVN